MFKRARLISIFTMLCLLVSFQVFVPSAFADSCLACSGGSVVCTDRIDNGPAGVPGPADPDTTGGGRTIFSDPASTCAVPQTCTVSSNTFFYDFFTWTNNTGGATPDCFTVTLTNTNCGVNLGSAAFLGNWNPTATCTNYIADMGATVASGAAAKQYSFNVANGATFTVIVTTNTNNVECSAGGAYTLSITPCPLSPTAADSTVTGRITDSNGAPISGAVINLTGTQNRKFITDANGNYLFDKVEAGGFYTVSPSRVNFDFSPSETSFSVVGSTTAAVFSGSSNGAAYNPVDTPEYFVRQHYLDFLGREPDEAGFNFWSDEILGCGADAACIERRRVNVSAAYFKSIEFRNTGGFVDALYRASYGRAPLYNEFMPDASTVARNVVVGMTNWEQNLLANKEAFLDAWVERAAFTTTFDLMTDSHYVDTLIANTGVSFSSSERDALVAGLTVGSLSRADVLRQIAEDQRFVSAKSNEMFVMMEYFGYLRRDPDPQGFQFWLDKLNQFNGNFEQAEMVKSFIVSSEYRNRFDH